jgi:hypothetical protein
MGTSGKCLSVVLSVAGDNDQGGQILRIDVPKIEGKFSGCGDLFTAMCGGNLPNLSYSILLHTIELNSLMLHCRLHSIFYQIVIRPSSQLPHS